MSKKTIPLKDVKILWGRSGNKCALCKTVLIKEEDERSTYPLGEIAHIEGENPGSARYNSGMTDDERRRYDNLILLCPNCHREIDNDCQTHTVEKLIKTKKDHEKWIFESLQKQMPNVTFAELEVIIKHIMAVPIFENKESLKIIPPKDKIEKNNLSSNVEDDITIGMLKVKQVKDYLNKNPDIHFKERLRVGFVEKYQELKEKLEGDALFYALLDYASNNSPDFKYISAGLSVLTYFFELCEVFEE